MSLPERSMRFRVLRAIEQYIARHEWPPSIVEIGATAGIASTSHVVYWLVWLTEHGYIRRGKGARKIALTDKGRAAFAEAR